MYALFLFSIKGPENLHREENEIESKDNIARSEENKIEILTKITPDGSVESRLFIALSLFPIVSPFFH